MAQGRENNPHEHDQTYGYDPLHNDMTPEATSRDYGLVSYEDGISAMCYDKPGAEIGWDTKYTEIDTGSNEVIITTEGADGTLRQLLVADHHLIDVTVSLREGRPMGLLLKDLAIPGVRLGMLPVATVGEPFKGITTDPVREVLVKFKLNIGTKGVMFIPDMNPFDEARQIIRNDSRPTPTPDTTPPPRPTPPPAPTPSPRPFRSPDRAVPPRTASGTTRISADPEAARTGKSASRTERGTDLEAMTEEELRDEVLVLRSENRDLIDRIDTLEEEVRAVSDQLSDAQEQLGEMTHLLTELTDRIRDLDGGSDILRDLRPPEHERRTGTPEFERAMRETREAWARDVYISGRNQATKLRETLLAQGWSVERATREADALKKEAADMARYIGDLPIGGPLPFDDGDPTRVRPPVHDPADIDPTTPPVRRPARPSRRRVIHDPADIDPTTIHDPADIDPGEATPRSRRTPTDVGRVLLRALRR